MTRFRLRYEFQLDMNNPKDAALGETIEDLKTNRTYVQTIRDGIRLIVSLRQGRLDVLNELFPWIQNNLIGVARLQAQPEPLHQREFAQMFNASPIEEVNIWATDAPPPDPAESRANFASGLGNLFDDDEDDF